MERRGLSLVRRRSLSQQAWRRQEDRVAASAKAPVRSAVDGRSYLLPTVTLQRSPGSNAIAPTAPADAPLLLQTRTRLSPVVLDLQRVSSDGSPHAQPIKKHELRAEIERLHDLGFSPVGVTNASEDVKQLAAKLRLPYFISTRLPSHLDQSEYADDREPAAAANTSPPPEQPACSSSAAAPSPTPSRPPMIVYASVRSGQQVYARGTSLVVLGSVNSGAEVLADDDVIVMGALKGRALAGIGGNADARIICQSFDAELVSIAHHFTTCDDLAAEQTQGDLRPTRPTTIWLQHDRLHFESAP
ncbi:hypothetical protein ATCC90586_010279 [Pythium insidiosum]|nr:hypothetical protein ATCC90586_010279 [Pythium insidiosum]